MTELLNNLFFIFQRISWLSVFDIMLVTLIFFGLLYSLRDTQAMALLRGMILLVVALIPLARLREQEYQLDGGGLGGPGADPGADASPGKTSTDAGV